MKKIFAYILLMFVLFTNKSFSQFKLNYLGQVYSGYGTTHYNMKGYDNTGYVPFGVRAAIGAYSIQLGADLCTNIKNPEFNIKDASGQLVYTDLVKNNYLGAMLRFHMGDDPTDFAFILRGGVGLWYSKSIITYSDFYKQNFNFTDGTLKYKNSLGFNGAIGFSIPIDYEIHLTIEGQYNYNERKWIKPYEFHTSWSFQIGVSYNFYSRFDLERY